MLQEGLVVVKAAIQRANVPIYEDVLRLAEKKALIQMLNGLNTKQGTEPGYGGSRVPLLGHDPQARGPGDGPRLEAEIDKIQDKLNQFNATTTVEISQEVLDLAR